MAAQQDLDGGLSSVPPEALDRPCSEDHLKKLGLKLSDWRVVARLLGLDDKIRDIQQEGESTVERAIMMLMRWRKSHGEQATYRCLASVLRDIDRKDLVEKLCELVTFPTPPASTLAQSQSTTLQKYTNHLKSLFQTHRPAAIVQTLPPPTDKYFNLALIKKQRAEPPPDEEILHSIVQEGNVDRILKTKVKIKLADIFEADEAARKVILIEGAPGSGKITLSWLICQKWASGELFQQFSLVVLVQLRDPAIQSAAAITDLLPCIDDKLAQNAMLEVQSRGGEGILFVMDGWDELATDIHQKLAVQQLVQSSLANPFPKSAIVVTCRSESSGQLQELASSRIETMGFTPSSVKDYFSECLKGDSQAVEKLSEAVQQNPQIEASCYLPLNAAIIVAIFLITPNSKLPSTLHELFTSLVLTCILHHLQTRTQYKAIKSLTSLDALPDSVQSAFDHLCQLAFSGMEKNELSFSAEELGSSSGFEIFSGIERKKLSFSTEEAEIHSDFDTLSLLQGVQSFQFGLHVGVSKAYSFLHLSVQELLAARHISRLSLDKQVRLFHELIDHPRFTTVFRFFAGITQLKNERIAQLFLKLGESGEYDPHGQPDVTFEILQERYQYLYLTQPSQEWDDFKLSQLCHVDTRLLLFNCLYEARNPSLCQSVAIICGNTHRNPPLLHLDGTSMNAYDCLSVGYFLPWVRHTVSSEISIRLVLINDTCAKFLGKGLTEGTRETRSYGGGSVDTYTAVSLSIHLTCSTWKHEGVHYLTQLLQSSEGIHICGLKLYDCQLTHQDFQYLAEAVGSSKSLKVLKFLHTSLTKESRLVFGKMLQRNTTLKTLYIATADTEFITDIAEGLKHNRVLETVDFSGYINNCELKSLAEIISCNKQLKTLVVLSHSRAAESDGIFHLIEAIKHNSTLQNLRLYYIYNLDVQELELLANTLTINTTLEKLEYVSEETETDLSALAKRLWASGVLCQLLTIAIERTVEWFGEEETIKALETILLEWNLSK